MRLKVKDEQDDFIADNDYSLAQSYVALLNDKLPPMTYAIYSGGTMVGFTMFEYNTAEENDYDDEACYFIFRFMIDKNYQGRGFGKQAMQKIIEHIKTYPQGKAPSIYLSYDPNNEAARKLYNSFGFAETGEMDDGEVVAKLIL
jgi:diamine N-acetyltransferase